MTASRVRKRATPSCEYVYPLRSSGAVTGATGTGAGVVAVVSVDSLPTVSLGTVEVVVVVVTGAAAGAGACGEVAESVVSQTSSGSTEEISCRIRSQEIRACSAELSAVTRRSRWTARLLPADGVGSGGGNLASSSCSACSVALLSLAFELAIRYPATSNEPTTKG